MFLGVAITDDKVLLNLSFVNVTSGVARRGSRRGVDDVEKGYVVREKEIRSALPAEVERREHIRKEIMGTQRRQDCLQQ